MNTCLVYTSLVTADEKCWDPDQIQMEKQDNCISFEVVINKRDAWVVPRGSTFITKVTAVGLAKQSYRAISFSLRSHFCADLRPIGH